MAAEQTTRTNTFWGKCVKYSVGVKCNSDYKYAQHFCNASITSRGPFTLGAVFSHSQDIKVFNGGHIREVDTSNSGKTFFCLELSLRDSIRSFPQTSTTPWPQMGVNGEDESRAKPQRQTPNLTNKHQPQECQFGTQMYIVFFFSSMHSKQTFTTLWVTTAVWSLTISCDTLAKESRFQKKVWGWESISFIHISYGRSPMRNVMVTCSLSTHSLLKYQYMSLICLFVYHLTYEHVRIWLFGRQSV